MIILFPVFNHSTRLIMSDLVTSFKFQAYEHGFAQGPYLEAVGKS
jgi:hypothetical protein